MKISIIFALLQIVVVIYMILKELTTPYVFKHSIEIIPPAILFFVLLAFNLYFRGKEKKMAL